MKIPAQPGNNDPKDRENTQLSIPGMLFRLFRFRSMAIKGGSLVRSQEAESRSNDVVFKSNREQYRYPALEDSRD
jgi:hypothetical protein